MQQQKHHKNQIRGKTKAENIWTYIQAKLLLFSTFLQPSCQRSLNSENASRKKKLLLHTRNMRHIDIIWRSIFSSKSKSFSQLKLREQIQIENSVEKKPCIIRKMVKDIIEDSPSNQEQRKNIRPINWWEASWMKCEGTQYSNEQRTN